MELVKDGLQMLMNTSLQETDIIFYKTSICFPNLFHLYSKGAI